MCCLKTGIRLVLTLDHLPLCTINPCDVTSLLPTKQRSDLHCKEEFLPPMHVPVVVRKYILWYAWQDVD